MQPLPTPPNASGRLPRNLKGLTSLRYLAAIWVVSFHYLEYMPQDSWLKHSLARQGLVSVDFFFVLSGFILSHTYLNELLSAKFQYLKFMTRRLARIYPAHIVMLIAFVLFSWLAVKANIPLPNPERYRASAILPNVLLIHAWGVSPKFSFNYPSWSISAEWMAYLLFPVIMGGALWLARLTGKMRAAAAWPAIIGFAALLAVWAASEIFLGRPLTAHTTTWVALRILPEFALGICLHLAATHYGRISGWAVAGIGLAILVLAQFSAPHLLLVLLGAALVYATAATSRAGGAGILEHPVAVYLGEISYGLYMIHAFFGGLLFKAVSMAHLKLPPALEFFGAMVGVTILAALFHRLVETPGRNALLWLLTPRRKADTAAGLDTREDDLKIQRQQV